MKKILKYQLKDTILGCSIFILVILTCIGIAGLISITLNITDITITGSSFSNAIFCFAIGIGMYKEHCQMALQNSISRKDFFWSNLCITAVTSSVCTLFDLFILLLTGLTSIYELNSLRIMEILYPEFFVKNPGAVTSAVCLLFSFLLYALSFILGTLIAGAYCRIPKKYRTIYCIAVPVFFCGLFPTLSVAASIFFPGLAQKIIEILEAVMGVSGSNPFIGILTFAVIFGITAFICYRVLKRTEL